MCNLTEIKLLWHELLPYVDVVPCGQDVINKTGIIYDFFRESLAVCCDAELAQSEAFEYKNRRLANQQAVLNGVRESINTVGMPISLDAEFPHTPDEFIPVLETDGLFWVKVREPKHNAVALGGVSTTGLPLLLVVITMTGYAAVILWLLEYNSTKKKTFDKSFVIGFMESYWYAFISATTVGYGDKVAQTFVGKMFSMIWVLFGICLMSTFTAIITTVMASFVAPETSKPKPFYDEFIGVLDGSFDYLVLVKKSANSVLYPDTDSLTEALNNGSTFNIVMDKHAYWVYRAKIHQNQSFEFRPGVQNPTSIGYMYNTKNTSLLNCLKDFAMQSQVQVTARLEEIVKEAINTQPPDKVADEVTLFFGPHTYTVIACAIGILLAICVFGTIVDFVYRRKQEEKQADSSEVTPHPHTHTHAHTHTHTHTHTHEHTHAHTHTDYKVHEKAIN